MKTGWIGLVVMGTPMVARLRIVVDMSAIALIQSARALFSSRKSGLDALDKTAVYHYLEKGDH
ncbi:hypothetical protein JP0185_14270 [Helicobacter pylori]